MTRRLLAIIAFGGLLVAGMKVASPVAAVPVAQVVSTIQNSGGHYSAGGASLRGADCSGLVSVAQSLAMGVPIQRFGNTDSLLAGHWPHAIRGAQQSDLFIIGATSSHMVARVNGVGIEATTSGAPFVIGPAAKSPWTPGFQVFHLDPAVLAA